MDISLRQYWPFPWKKVKDDELSVVWSFLTHSLCNEKSVIAFRCSVSVLNSDTKPNTHTIYLPHPPASHFVSILSGVAGI